MAVKESYSKSEPVEQRTPSLAGRRVLFISYNGMLDPLGQSQVLPYLRQLAQRGVRFVLLSFEREIAFSRTGRERCETLRKELAGQNIEWHWLRYHQRPSVPATAYDVALGIRVAKRLVKERGIELVHARSHIPATIGLALKRRLGTKLIFDIRGLMAEEYADAEHWRETSIPYRLTKSMEAKILKAADGVVTLTEAVWPIIKMWPPLRQRTVVHEVIPTCTDLNLFKFDPDARAKLRREMRIEDAFVLVYSGSIDGWYLTETMAEFFSFMLKNKPNAHFLWLTPSRPERVSEVMNARGIGPGSFTVRSLQMRDVPSYLSACDVGIAFYKPGFSKLATSPTKYGEYLACGLPLIVNAGIGDSDALIKRESAGALVREFTEKEYAIALATIDSKMSDQESTRTKSREIAERLFDVGTIGVNRYARLYEKVLAA